MAIDKVREYLKKFGAEGEVMEFDRSSATVELAALALGTKPQRIAKTLSFKPKDGNGCVLVVAAGDAKVDNAKFKAFFGCKAKMLSPDEVEVLTGHKIGGVCPFANPQGAEVYLDLTLRRFDTVFPACGSDNSAIELDMQRLFEYSAAKEWVDVCKLPE